ncbi:MAG: exo 1 [Bacteroidetes bacterium]|jgi:hexosaminidase|nr:exo 1 [Bacteroidota bacterium]
MKCLKCWGLMLSTIFLSGSSFATGKANISIIPKPNQITVNDGRFVFKNEMTVKAPANSRAKALLSQKLETAAGITLKNSTGGQANLLFSIRQSAELGQEGYRLQVTKNQIKLEAATENGLYYAVQSLLQLLPPQIESKAKISATWEVPCVNITDAPRFSYRGVMLDCSRHFSTIEEIKKMLDVFAIYKINKFHWHLTDDQGWRIEIKRYPKLTEIGAFRMEDGKPYGGFYTQEQVKDILKYAAERNIEVIPEIEMPGHGLAALAAYPEYSCTGGPFKPRTIWGVEDDVFCAGNEPTYQFLQNILDEVCALFPSKYVHVGGDECPKVRWKECPKCQAVMKSNGLKNEMELQSYFTKRIEKYLESKGKRLFGWDEILEGGIAPSATIMSWRGEQGGIEAANAGHDVVMTPGGYVYLDHYQGDLLCEQVKIGGLSTLQNVYGYNPIPKSIAPDKAHHVLGLQGNLWQEYMYEPSQIEFQLFPRVTAIAEVGWTKLENKDLDSFIQRIDDQQIRWDFHDVNYYIPMPEGNMNYIQFVDKVTLPFTTSRPVKIVYTLDGSEPNAASPVYTGSLTIDKSVTLKLRSILPQGKLSPVRIIELTKTVPYKGLQKVENLRKGMKMRYVKDGDYTAVDQLASISNWKDTVAISVNDFFKFKKKEQSGGAAILDGYIYVEKDGSYILHCLADQFYLDGKLLIVNDKMKKNAKSDITVPLTAGYYPIKIVFLNRVYAGVVSEWMDARPTVRPVDNSNRELPTPVYY